jgi:threonine/homoserine/homoserine lactone efflux protein
MLYFRFPRRPRHPLGRLLYGAVAVLAVLVLVAVGTFALAALAVGGAFFLLFNAVRSAQRPAAAGAARHAASAPPPGVIEGEFSVVQPARPRAGATPPPQ